MSLVFDYSVALTQLYGLVHKEKVVEIYNMQNNDKVNLTEIEKVMSEKRQELKRYFVYIDGEYFVQEAIMEFDEMDLHLEQQVGKPYYIPNKRELLKYKDEEYFERTKESREMYAFIKKHIKPGSINSVQDIFRDMVGDCQIEMSVPDILNDLTRLGVELPTEQEVGEAMDLIVNLANNTRLWSNKGHTPNEIFEQYERPYLQPLSNQGTGLKGAERISDSPRIKIGRNDPCPCGSGKKYKKCCGR